ncbi:hypothetical protein V8C86DRAFT_2599201 [Haematococcus lacustris]
MPAVGECEGIQGPSESALHANIKAKGQNAYYYAHASRNISQEPPAPLPVHVPLEVTVQQAPSEMLEPIMSGYQFLDEGPHVKVYLPLEGVGAKCSRQCPAGAEAGEGLQPVSWELGVRQVSLKVRGYKEGRTLLFEVKRLGGDIVPEACTFKVLPNKVVLMLTKAGNPPPAWSSLVS